MKAADTGREPVTLSAIEQFVDDEMRIYQEYDFRWLQLGTIFGYNDVRPQKRVAIYGILLCNSVEVVKQ